MTNLWNHMLIIGLSLSEISHMTNFQNREKLPFSAPSLLDDRLQLRNVFLLLGEHRFQEGERPLIALPALLRRALRPALLCTLATLLCHCLVPCPFEVESQKPKVLRISSRVSPPNWRAPSSTERAVLNLRIMVQ